MKSHQAFLLINFALLLSGCSTQGALLRTEKVPNSEQLISSTVDVVVKPSQGSKNSVIEFRLIQRNTYSALYRKVYERRGSGSGFLGGLAVVVGGGVLVDTAYRQEQTGGQVAGVAIMLAGAALAVGSSTIYVNDRILETSGETQTRRTERPEWFRSNESVSVTAEGKTRTYLPQADGTVRIDVVADFGLRQFERNRPITFSFRLPGVTNTLSTSLQVEEWTTPFMLMKGEGWVFERPSGRSPDIGVFQQNEQFEVLEQQSDWIKILYKGKEGWVPPSVGTVRWMAQ